MTKRKKTEINWKKNQIKKFPLYIIFMRNTRRFFHGVIPLQGMTAAVIQYERKRSCCLTLHVILTLAMLMAPLFAHDYWLEPGDIKCDGLAGLLGGGGGGIATKIICGIKIPSKGPDDIFQCYTPDNKGICHPSNLYASRSELPALEQPKTLERDISCYRYKNEAYIVVETSIPEQVIDSMTQHPISTRCYIDSLNCQQAIIKQDSETRSPYHFHFCKNTETTAMGCPVSEKGLSLVFNEKGQLTEWNLDALRLYLDMKSENNVSRFMKRAEQERTHKINYTITLPWKFSKNDAIALSTSSVQNAKGMLFFSGTKKEGRIDIKLNSMQDAINTCKEQPLKNSVQIGGKK